MVTTKPPAGAGELICRVAISVLPPTIFAGENESSLTTGGVTVTAPVTVVPFAIAETVTVVFAVTPKVVKVKGAVVAPAAIVTVAGTVPAAVALEVRLTT
jgi:hypothetical protein